MNIIQKNGKYWKECDIVMLPTRQNTNILKRNKSGEHAEGFPEGTLTYLKNPDDRDNTNSYWNCQHLYLLSNEQINEGDWFISNNEIIKGDNNLLIEEYQELSVCKKIIASTDTNLHYTKCNHCGHLNQMHDWSCNNCHKQGSLYFSVPKLTENFIKKYVESNGSIQKVLVEYEGVEGIIEQRINTIHTFEYKIKLNPDNTINILIEDSVEEAAKKYAGIPLNADMEDEKYYNSTGFSNFNAFIEGAKWKENQLNN